MYDVEFSHDGRYLVYGSGGVHVMDFATREEVMVLDDAFYFAIHPSENVLAVGAIDPGAQPPYTWLPVVKLWNIATNEYIDTLRVTRYGKLSGYVTDIAFSPDGETVGMSISNISDSTCGTANVATVLFNVRAGEFQTPRIISSSNHLAFSPDGRYVAGVLEYQGGPNAGIIQTWDLRAWTARSQLRNSDFERWINPQDFQFSPDSQTLTAIAYGLLLRWNVISGKLLNEIALDTFDYEGRTIPYYNNGSLTYAPDGERIVLVTPTTLQMWNADLTEHTTITLNDSFANVQIHPSGNFVIIRDSAQQTRIWTPDGIDSTTHILQTSEKRLNYQFSENGEVVAYVQDDTLHVWFPNTEDEFVIDGGFSYDDQLVLSRDGSVLAQWTPIDQIHLWNMRIGEPISTLTGEFPHRGDVILSPAGTTVVTTQATVQQEDNQSSRTTRTVVTLWSIETGEPLHDLGEFPDTVYVDYSQDGTRLGIRNQFIESSLRHHLAQVVDVDNGQIEFSHSIVGDAAYFSPDLDLFVADTSSYHDLNLEFYDTETGNRLTPDAHEGMYDGEVWGFTPDNTQILVAMKSFTGCGGDYRALDVYNIPSAYPSHRFGLPSSPLGIGSETFDFTSSGEMLMLATEYGISFSDLQREKPSLGYINVWDRQAYFNLDDTLIVTTGSDGTIRLYGVLSEGG